MRRKAVLLLALVLLPVVCLRGPAPAEKDHPRVWRRDLLPGLIAERLPRRWGPFELAGAWRIDGDDPSIANYSALGTRDDGSLVALSDRRALLTFTRPDRPGPWLAHPARPFTAHTDFAQDHSDGEALVVLPPPAHGAPNDLLLIFEGTADVVRVSGDLRRRTVIPVPALAAWPGNMGPEASTRLRDGRMVMIEEGYAPWYDRSGHDALVFPGLPRKGDRPAHWRLRLPGGWRPTELAVLPDGRLLLLERRFTLTGFRSAIAWIDPAAIRPGATVVPQPLARIEDPRIRDNYEGMTVTREPDGATAVWLIADSNGMDVLQRTLLLKLRIVAPF